MQAPWKVVAAVVTGADHTRVGLPCQDALATDTFDGPAGPTLVAAVSDGAGSARLAEDGARLATATTVAFLRTEAATLGPASDPDALAQRLLAATRSALEAAAAEAEATLSDYACTLLVGAVTPAFAFFAQLGDGAIVVTHDAEVLPPVDVASNGPPSEGRLDGEIAATATADATEDTPAQEAQTTEIATAIISDAMAPKDETAAVDGASDALSAAKDTDTAVPADGASSNTDPTAVDAASAQPTSDAPADTPVTHAPSVENADAAGTSDAPTVPLRPAATSPRCLFWPAKGEHANETVFVTSSRAAAYIEAALIRAPVHDVALFTDGLERLALDFAARAAFPGFFGPFFGAMRAVPADPDALAALSAELGAFLDSPRVHAASSDDRALVLATRLGA